MAATMAGDGIAGSRMAHLNVALPLKKSRIAPIDTNHLFAGGLPHVKGPRHQKRREEKIQKIP
jgi:hypothetical protein